MSQPPSIPYASPNPYTQMYSPDLSYLKTLAICHWVWGGLIMFFSSFGLIHIVMGIMVVTGNFGPRGGGPDQFIGWFFLGFGSVFVVGGWTFGLLNIFCGFHLKKQRKKLFTMIISAINCMFVPVGTVLGVFTFIVLARPAMKDLYNQ